jgi:hypothetical protein
MRICGEVQLELGGEMCGFEGWELDEVFEIESKFSEKSQ